jgi:hypothetical protein
MRGGPSSEREEKERADDACREKWKPNVRHFRTPTHRDALNASCSLSCLIFRYSPQLEDVAALTPTLPTLHSLPDAVSGGLYASAPARCTRHHLDLNILAEGYSIFVRTNLS